MQNSKKGQQPMRHGITLSKDMSPKTLEEVDSMRNIPYASAVGSLMYAMLCTRSDICNMVGIVSRYQLNPRMKHWELVKHILKYLRRTRNYMLVYLGSDLMPIGYTDSDFQFNSYSKNLTSLFTLNGSVVVWRRVKQSYVSNSTMEAEYVATFEVAKKVVRLCNF